MPVEVVLRLEEDRVLGFDHELDHAHAWRRQMAPTQRSAEPDDCKLSMAPVLADSVPS
jgi:hypothetical protein